MKKSLGILAALAVLAVVVAGAPYFVDDDADAASTYTLNFMPNNSTYGGCNAHYTDATNMDIYFASGRACTPGETYYLTAFPRTDCEFVEWRKGSTAISSSASLAYTMPSGNVTLIAIFKSTITYTITWENYDGTVLETDTDVEPGDTPTYDGATPTRPSSGGTSYTFSGWSPMVSAATGDQTYTAQFTASYTNYNVSFDVVPSGLTSISTVSKRAGSEFYTTPDNSLMFRRYDLSIDDYIYSTQVNAPAVTGYTFSGWSPSSGTVNSSMMITATYTIDTFTITWENYDGTVLETDNNVTYGTTPTYDSSTPVRASTDRYDYTFSGWSPTVSAASSDQTYTAQFDSTVRSYDITITAGTGGSVDVSTVYNVEYGTSISIANNHLTIGSTVITATPSGAYSFGSWQNTSWPSVINGVVANFGIGSYTYSLTYNTNGGQTADWVDSITVSADSYQYTISDTEPEKTGYVFLGWADADNATAADYTAGDVLTLQYSAPTKTIYAVYQVGSFVLVYNANGGSGAPESQIAHTADSTYNFQISSVRPTRSDYNFIGWALTSDATAASYQPSGRIMVSDPSTTLYAVWTDQAATYSYTLVFNANGGSGAPATLTSSGTSLMHTFTIPDIKPEKSGYTFIGWSNAATATAASFAPGAQYTVSADATVTLYAVWKESTSMSLSFDNLIKMVGQTFFGGSTSVAGLALMVVAWLVCIAILANIGASPMYSAIPMIPIILVFAAYNIVSPQISILMIIVCAILSATTVRNMITRGG